MIEAALVIILILHMLVLLLVAGFVMFKWEKKKSAFPEPPQVAVLVAARNEAHQIEPLLESLARQNYPEGKFEVWVGNDHSEDDTAGVVSRFITDKPNFHLINITETLGQARGKSNVLAQLVHISNGEVIFITDADMILPPDWISSLLSYMSPEQGLVTGSTVVQGRGGWARMQELEWTYLMGMFHTLDHIYPVTAMGNNMAFLRKAYAATGGYENMPFCITEDYQLMQEMKKKGYSHRQLLLPECLGRTAPVHTLKGLLRQRKRWFQGSGMVPWYMQVLSGLYSCFLPVILILLLLNWQLSLWLILAKLVMDGIIMTAITTRLRLPSRLWLLPVFELYLFVVNFLSLIYALLPGGVEWKGRRYD